MNCFFSIDIGDPSLKGLLVASIITSQKSKSVDSVTFVNEYKSRDVGTLFVPLLQDICPTLIAAILFKKMIMLFSLNTIQINSRTSNMR